ncbi:hypothetical protein HDEF_2277 [Candidatus Hamiltonella defensa 5AT (Acyrthosiphon pisum)]|uniref:Uncharacterized protein n=1 Tax=Hamiltonella defensa subsp. Acyrthosiphon pisum (strain 5AT) TaxID=572265 RepID=C4K8G1_HAMD5|nr:hypothetical protein HDEF_2277 [Candidatus Hamiltonella defensa 5AT (Acyrthosiphon pisum)]
MLEAIEETEADRPGCIVMKKIKIVRKNYGATHRRIYRSISKQQRNCDLNSKKDKDK